jgi:hypothetical protein
LTITPSPDEPVSADDTVLRRVPPLMVVADPKVQGGKRASSAVFKDDRDGSSMSVYLDSAVRALGLEARDVLHAKVRVGRWRPYRSPC